MVAHIINFIQIAIPFVGTWLCAFFSKDMTYRTEILVYGPLVVFGSLAIYAAISIIHGVATFNDCPEAKNELLKEIKEARKDLQRRKIIS